jgi:two-component system, OmpR family, osmolarity sensor histidine kinase EnvZ
MTKADSTGRRSSTRQKFRIKRFLPKSLFGRALLIIVMPLILLQVVTTWIFFDRHWDVVSRRLASGVAGEVSATIALLRDIPAETGERQALLDGLSPAFNLYLGFSSGTVLPNTRPRDAGWLSDDALERALKVQVRRPFQLHSSGFNAPREVRVQLADGVLTVVVPEKRLFTATTVLFVVWMVGSSMVLFAVAGLFMSNQVRPIRRLADAAEAFGKGRDPGDFQVRGATEVRQAAMAFKLMRERIMRQVAQRTAMLAGGFAGVAARSAGYVRLERDAASTGQTTGGTSRTDS